MESSIEKVLFLFLMCIQIGLDIQNLFIVLCSYFSACVFCIQKQHVKGIFKR